MSAVELLELAVGEVLVMDQSEWRVDVLEPHYGRAVLTSHTGERLTTSFRMLANHPNCRRSTAGTVTPAALRGRQPKALSDLEPDRVKLLRVRQEHLLEVETGFRSGDPLAARPGEPRPQYDPDRTTVSERRWAKVAELRAMDPVHAEALALDQVSYRTLIRWESGRRADPVMGCADNRWTPRTRGHPSITETIREAILVVREETRHRSKITMKARADLIRQYVLEKYGEAAAAEVPSYGTLRVVWMEWFGTGRARQKYDRSAALETSGQRVVVQRPGQVVALDTTILPVLVRESVFDDPVAVHLTLAMDVYTHSLLAFRLTLVSDTSTDVAMVLRDVMSPLPMRPDWGDDMEWPYPGVPAALVAEFAGHKVAALPFFAPETVTTDHGSVYRNYHLIDVQQTLNIRILPARILRPTDKSAVERAFGAIRTLLFEYLPGYVGVDVADRGADPDGDAALTVDQMEHLLATWIVKIWQNRRLGGHAPCWDPVGDHSPNTLFAAAMVQCGWDMEIPSPNLYYKILPRHVVVIHGERGVKIRGLWYNGDALDPYRHQRSGQGGRRRDRWHIHHDPRDARMVFFQDPRTHDWHTLRWTGLPPEGEIPSFSDARVQELLTAANQCGLRPKTDQELLPLLLELLAAHVPIAQWPSRMPKGRRKERAREIAQGRAAAADRPDAVDPPPTPVSWSDRVRETEKAIDMERRRRREDAVSSSPGRPQPLGASDRRLALSLIPDEEDVQDDPS
ncbi:transposase [Streptomyces ossamyceticus]|uniref:transposase n=1 Tax=Streptomyces ossamyceticus TaxID=249581 RepID=UPI0006E37F1F|nr:transposase [Streptomyces ossamyceticus]